MSLAWLIDPQHQFMTKSGTINVGGTIRVFEAVTDDPVLTFKDFSGTENELSVVLDSNGRANVIADPSKAYRVEVYDRYGTLMWTAGPVWCLESSGDGATGTEVISSDGSISVVKTVTGGMTQFDISNRVDDSTDLLEWIASSGDSEYHDGAFHLVYNAGTMEMGERGVRLGARRYYHVTAEVTVSKDVVHPVYDNIDFVLYFRDGEGALTEVAKFSRVGDYSMGLSQCWTVACDCMPENDVELVLRVEGKDLDDAGGFSVTRFDVHRVFSGAPALPGGAVSKDMLDEGLAEKQDVIDDLSEIRAGAEAGATAVQPGDLAAVATSGSYNDLSNKPDLSGFATKSEVTSGLASKQDTLIAGDNITIEDNVISATGGGGGGGSSYTAGEGINIQNDEISVDTSVIQEKLTAGSNITISGTTISASAAPQEQADWSQTDTAAVDFIKNKPNIPTFTSEQQAAINSGINSTKVGTYDTHVADTTIHVTSTDKTNWNAKEDASNKKQSIDDSSTTDYPSSKAVADFVNSSVATATARFLGSFTLTDLGLTYGATNAQIATALDNHTWPSGTTPTNNDYVYVEIQDPQTTGIDDEVRRFKFNGTVWAYEYTLNNSSFTAAEKAAIDSGITSNLVTAYSGHVADSTIHVTSSDKTTWNAKQDAISDLSTIRSGASAGATAVQPGDIDQTYNSSSTSAQSGTAVAGAIAGVRQVPTTQSTDNGKVLGVTDANGTLGWVAQSGGGSQVQTDWDETNTASPAYLVHKPAELGLSAGTNITLTESGNSLTISANFTQVQSDWEETNTASPAYLAGKPLITRVIPGTLTENSTNSDLMAICNFVDQYSSSGDVLLVKGSWTGATDAMWRFIEKYQSSQNAYTYLFKLIVEDFCVAYVYIIYDSARPTAYIDSASTENLSTQTLYSGRCININYNQSTHHDEINWTTTAGITDIQQVAALPANPVSTVLYLIPAT